MRITADAVNNTLLIYANQESYRIIEQTLRQLDRPQLQVSIDATIAEITLNDAPELRRAVFLSEQRSSARMPDKGSGLISAQRHQRGAGARAAGLQLPARQPRANPRVILDALRAVSDVKVLSTPSVVVLDNQVATLQVGDQMPVTTAIGTVAHRHRARRSSTPSTIATPA